MKESIILWIKSFYISHKGGQIIFDQVKYEKHQTVWALGMFLLLILASFILWWITRVTILRVLNALIDHTKISWDDHFKSNKVFHSLAHLVPFMFMQYFLTIVFYEFPTLNLYSSRLVQVLIVFVIMTSINRSLNAFRDLIKENIRYQDKPIQSYFQVTKIVVTGVFLILMLSVLTNQTPMFFLTSLGAMTAILILVFKDTILGFVGSIQLSTNDMIRIGDWITMDKYGADGDVIEINVATVKIQNFDKTITTIPTYSFISDSFKNWRGMQESGGRRIKRSINIQIDSIHFASPDLIAKLKKISIIKEFISEREKEIEKYNLEMGFVGENAVNARKQTNVGLFRRYVEYYLKHNPFINQRMILMIHQLEANEFGVPIEMYCFTTIKEWGPYETVVADVFDHIFAIVPEFELRIFENPSGADFKQLLTTKK